MALTTPPLVNADGTLETESARKVDLLRASFFSPPAQADLSEIPGTISPTPYQVPHITEPEIERAIRKAAPNKAPGPDGITNGILQKVLDHLLPTLHRLFNASWTIGYFPRHFRESITVVLRKSGKDDYSQPKAYRPIALLNTIGKVIETAIAIRLMFLAERYNLLSSMYIEEYKLVLIEHAFYRLLNYIYKA